MRDFAIDAAARLSRSLPPLRGRGRVALALHQRVPDREGSWTIRMRRGHWMAVPANSSQSWRAVFTGSYDDEIIERLIPFIRPASLVLDVGASLGFYTIPFGLAAQQVGARVVAIEPIGQNCEVIQRNIELNGLQDIVSVVQCALGRTSGEVTLHVESGGAGNATIVNGLDSNEIRRHDRAGNTGASETAMLQTLDNLELPGDTGSRVCSLLKIDAEGFEMDILAGAESFIATHRPVLFAEFNPSWLKTRAVSNAAPIRWGESNGYACHQVAYGRASPWSDAQHVGFEPIASSERRSGTDLMLLPVPSA